MGNMCCGNFDPPRPSGESNSKKKKSEAVFGQPMRRQSGSQSKASDKRVAAEKLYKKSQAPSSSTHSDNKKDVRIHGSSTNNKKK